MRKYTLTATDICLFKESPTSPQMYGFLRSEDGGIIYPLTLLYNVSMDKRVAAAGLRKESRSTCICVDLQVIQVGDSNAYIFSCFAPQLPIEFYLFELLEDHHIFPKQLR